MMTNQKGITVLVALFLMVALASLAINLAQVTVVDTKGITAVTPAGIARHRMGPKKEIERLQVFYLAQAGLNHLRKLLMDNPAQTALAPFYNNDDATATGYYRAELVLNGTVDSTHTLLADLLAVSEGRVLPHDNTNNPDRISTNLELREQYWRSSRVFVSSLFNPPTYSPVGVIDASDLPQNEGLDKPMGTRAAPLTNTLTVEGIWSPKNCGGVGLCVNDAWFLLEFGMPVAFDEIRFLNTYRSWIQEMTLYTWDETSGSWTLRGTNSFPAAGTDFTPFYVGGLATVYNGDRCSDFLDANTNLVIWEAYSGGGCSGFSQNDAVYIGRFKLASSVTTSRIKIVFDGYKNPTPFEFQVFELGVYCCDPTNSFPSPSTNVLKVIHGQARAGLQYTAYGGLSPLNPNAESVQNQGTLLKGSVAYE